MIKKIKVLLYIVALVQMNFISSMEKEEKKASFDLQQIVRNFLSRHTSQRLLATGFIQTIPTLPQVRDTRTSALRVAPTNFAHAHTMELFPFSPQFIFNLKRLLLDYLSGPQIPACTAAAAAATACSVGQDEKKVRHYTKQVDVDGIEGVSPDCTEEGQTRLYQLEKYFRSIRPAFFRKLGWLVSADCVPSHDYNCQGLIHPPAAAAAAACPIGQEEKCCAATPPVGASLVPAREVKETKERLNEQLWNAIENVSEIKKLADLSHFLKRIKKFIDRGADVNYSKRNSFLYRALLSLNAFRTTADDPWQTVHFPLIYLLVARGADINKNDPEFRATPLLYLIEILTRYYEDLGKNKFPTNRQAALFFKLIHHFILYGASIHCKPHPDSLTPSPLEAAQAFDEQLAKLHPERPIRPFLEPALKRWAAEYNMLHLSVPVLIGRLSPNVRNVIGIRELLKIIMEYFLLPRFVQPALAAS